MLKSESAQKPKPLEGVKIIEYGVFHAGPGAGAILGDLGAEVIKIEYGEGDPERNWTKIADMDLSFENGDSVLFEVTNRNKKGICLDIKTEKGREVFHRLIKSADVFLTNLRKSTRKALEIDYPSISKINHKIIQATVSGYGQEGPLSDIGAFDPIGQAISGMMFTSGLEVPTMLRTGILDQATAIAASQAILTALYFRERKGVGQEVHVSLYSTALWLQHFNLMVVNTLSVNPCVPTIRDHHSPLRNYFLCKDNKWIMSTHHPEEKYWAVFCKITGREDLLNSKFTDDSGAPLNYAELIKIFDKIFLTKKCNDWMEIFISHGLMFSPVRHIDEVSSDVQAIENDYIVPYDHPVQGKMNIAGYPIHFSACSAGTSSSAPALGEHTDQILEDVGYLKNEICDLKKDGIINGTDKLI